MNFTRDGRMFAMAMLFAASLQAHAQGGEAPASAPLGEAASADAAPTPSKAADRALRRRVLNALAKAKGLRASGISVRATHGAVTLEGWVPEQAQIDQATRVAQGVTGVNSVKNTLTLSTF